MTIFTKKLKPSKFRIDAFYRAFEDAAEEFAKEVKKEFEITTIGWKTQVQFDYIVAVGPQSIDVLVDTDNEIYRYVNDGTVPHIITAKRAKTLAFQWGGPGSYTAKTAPGKQVHNPAGGGVKNARWVYPIAVSHPGTKARNFDKTITKMMKSRFKRAMEEAMRKGARNSGHSI